MEQADVNAPQVEDVVQGGEYQSPYPHHQPHRGVEEVEHVGEQEQTPSGEHRTHQIVFVIVKIGNFMFFCGLVYYISLRTVKHTGVSNEGIPLKRLKN